MASFRLASAWACANRLRGLKLEQSEQCALWHSVLIQRETHATNLESHRYQLHLEVLFEDFVMVALTVLIVACLDEVLSNAEYTTKQRRYLIAANQQWSDLLENTKICDLFYRLIFHRV